MRAVSLPILFLLLLLAAQAQAQGGIAKRARLMVMLEVPGNAPIASLEFAELLLETEEGERPLEQLRPEWSTKAMAGRQTRIVDQPLAPGHLVALRFELTKIIAPAGAAPVQPSLPELMPRIELNLTLEAGEAAFVLLRWTPLWVEDDSTEYHVKIELLQPEIPPLGNLVFVSAEGSDLITVLDNSRHRVVAAIGAVRGPRDLVYSAREQRLFCALSGTGELLVIDALGCQVEARIQIGFSDKPSRLAMDRDESTVFVLNSGSSTLSAYGSYSLQEQYRVPVGRNPLAMVHDDSSGLLYISSRIDGEIFVFDPLTRQQVARFSVASQPTEMVIDPLEKRLHVGTDNRRRILVLDPRSGAELSRMEICDSPQHLLWVPGTRRLYASIAGCQLIAIVSPENAVDLGTIQLDESAGRMALGPDYRRLYVTLPEANALGICELGSRELERIIDVGKRPYAVVVP